MLNKNHKNSIDDVTMQPHQIIELNRTHLYRAFMNKS